MARKSASPYRRLPGGRLTRYSLWQAHDHLLNVQRREFTERYERFYFRDIQAIVLQRTSTAVVLTVIFLSLTALMALLALTRKDANFMVFWGIMTATFGTVALWNWRLGPTCVCYLFTAIDRYRVRALSRVKIAERVIDQLQPLIQRAQQDLEMSVPSEPSVSDLTGENEPELRQTQVTHARAVAPPPVLHYHGAIHLAVFVLLLVNAGFLTGALLWHGVLTVAGYAATLAALGVCMIVALVKQAGTDLPRSIQGFVWAQLGYLILSAIIGVSFVSVGFYTSMRDVGPEILEDEAALARMLIHFSPLDFPVFVGLYVALIATALMIGGLGLILLRRFRQAGKPVGRG